MIKEKVYILDEESGSVALLQKELAENHFETRHYFDIGTGLREIETAPPDLLMLDPYQIGNRNLEIIQELKSLEALKTVPFLLSSRSGEDETGIRGLLLGGDDFIPKPVKIKETVSRIRSLLRRRRIALTPPEREILLIADLEIRLNDQEVRKNGTTLKLTRTEAKILKELFRNPGNVIPRQNLIASVWPGDKIVEEQNLDVHIGSLRKKLEKNHSRPAILITVRGYGYKLNPSYSTSL